MSNNTNYPKLTWKRFSETYTIVEAEGTKKAKVLRVSAPQPSLNSVVNPGGTTRILNLNVVFPHNMQRIVDLFKEGNGEIEYSDLNGLTATFNLESNSGIDTPVKGEEIKIICNWYTPRQESSPNFGKEILVINSISVPEATNAVSFATKFGDLNFGVEEDADFVTSDVAANEGDLV
jgi:hypothetical protein